MICTLTSACGLFKKTSKDLKKVEHAAKLEQVGESQKKEMQESSDQSFAKVSEHIQEREKKNLNIKTTLEANEITIDDKGNIRAKGDAKLASNIEEKGEKENNVNKSKQESVSKEISKDRKEQKKEVVKLEKKDIYYSKEVKSETDGWGLIFGAVGLAVVIVGVVWLLKK